MKRLQKGPLKPKMKQCKEIVRYLKVNEGGEKNFKKKK